MKIRINITHPYQYVGYRVLHYVEGGYEHKLGYPAVHPSVDAPSIPFTEPMQILSYGVMKRVSPQITPEQWTRVFGDGTAVANDQGFGGTPPRRNYITGEDVNDHDSELPKLLKAIIFAGTFIRGEQVGNLLRCIPGVHGVDVTKSLPDVDTVLSRNWYTNAVSADQRAATHFIPNTPTPIVYFLKEIVTYPIEWFVEWNEGFLPDPLRFYL
jgi:hypothetical protein